MKPKSTVPGNNQQSNKASEVTTRQYKGSDRSNYGMIPFEDGRLVRKHGGLGLFSFWFDCWEADPYGSRFVLMPDADLSSTTQAKYRKQLEALGLFLFETRKLGGVRSLWVLNRHGSRLNNSLKTVTQNLDPIEK